MDLNISRRAFGAAILVALVAAPARAQMPNVNLIPETPSKTPDEIEREKQQDKAYKDSLRKIPDAKSANDPWGGMRSSGSAEPPHAKPSGHKSKAGIRTGNRAKASQ